MKTPKYTYKEYYREYYYKNKEKMYANHEKWLRSDKGKKYLAKQKALYFEKNKEKILEWAEQMAYCEEHRRERKRTWLEQKAYYTAHKEEIAAARRARNRVKDRTKYHNHPTRKINQYRNRKKQVERLTDGYIRRTLWAKYKLKSNEISPKMIQIQREYLIIMRMLKKKESA